MTSKPVMLLDLDGVLNALTNPITVPGLPDSIRTVPKTLTRVWPQDSWRVGSWTIDRVKFPLLWAVDVTRQIKAWHEDADVEIRWHTTWQHEAPKVAKAVFGLPEFQVANAPEALENQGVLRARLLREAQVGWWKHPAVMRVLTEERRPVIWVDDDINREVTRMQRDRMGLRGTFLPICPDSGIGLTPRHLRLINLFIEQCQEGEDDGPDQDGRPDHEGDRAERTRP